MLLGQRVQPQLIVFLLRTAVILDTIRFDTSQVRWTEAAFYIIVAGIVIGLLPAILGLLAGVPIPRGTQAKRIGAVRVVPPDHRTN
jgi:uncharacterized membrane protein